MAKGESKTSARRLKSLKRQEEILALRIAGKSYSQIGAHFNMSRQAAHAAVLRAIEMIKQDLREPVEQVKALELARLDALQIAVFKVVFDTQNKAVDMKAVDRALAIMDRRAKFLGLDAPTKIAPTDPTGNDEYHDLAGFARSKLADLIARRVAESPEGSGAGEAERPGMSGADLQLGTMGKT